MGSRAESGSTRIVGYDLARAFAVFGMVVVNFKIVMGAESAGPGWLVSLVGLLDGRAAATFVILAGVGISLFSRRSRESGEPAALRRNRLTLLRRSLFLFLVGLAYTPIWPADILHFYGVYIAVATLMLRWPPRRLMGTAVGLSLLSMLLIFLLDYEAGWDWETLTYDGFWTAPGMVRHLFFNGFHPVVPWLGFLLIGMALGRLDLEKPEVRRRVLQWSVVTAIVGEGVSLVLSRALVSSGLQGRELEDLMSLVGAEPMPPTPLYMLAATGTAVTVIVLCVSIGLRHGSRLWIRPLISTGQLALTLYVAHVLLGMGVMEELGVLENQSLAFSLTASGVFCAASVLFATVWRKWYRRGPLEWIMRRLTDLRSRGSDPTAAT